jgi:hypothetical protein
MKETCGDCFCNNCEDKDDCSMGCYCCDITLVVIHKRPFSCPNVYSMCGINDLGENYDI